MKPRNDQPNTTLPPVMNTLKTFFLLSLLFWTGALNVRAQITWAPPANITGPTDVSTSGNLVYAWTWGAAATNNGVVFAATTSQTTVGGALVVAFPATTGQSSTTFGTGAAGTAYAALPGSYQRLIEGGVYGGSGAAGTLTLNGLKVGDNYQVQLWVSASTSSAPSRPRPPPRSSP
jgi:hypothetical protein